MNDQAWSPVMASDDLREHKAARVEMDDQLVMLYRDGERIWAIGAKCTHQGAPLDRGRVKVGGSLETVTCPAHGSMFDLADGSVVRGPASAPVPAFEVRVSDGSIELRPR